MKATINKILQNAITLQTEKKFDFEKKIAKDTKINPDKFMKNGYYLFLRSSMIERWNTLNKFHTYPNMLTPLKID